MRHTRSCLGSLGQSVSHTLPTPHLNFLHLHLHLLLLLLLLLLHLQSHFIFAVPSFKKKSRHQATQKLILFLLLTAFIC